MRITERQKRRDTFTMKHLTGNGTVCFFGTNGRDQRMMPVIPEGQWNVRFIAQPRVCPIGTYHQTRREHGAIFQRQEDFVFAPCHLLQFGRCHQRDIGGLLRFCHSA